MDTPFLTTLGLLFLLCISDQQKQTNFIGDHPMNIPTKFSSNCPLGFREEDKKCKSSPTMQTMVAI